MDIIYVFSCGVCLLTCFPVPTASDSSVKDIIFNDYDRSLRPGFYGGPPVEVFLELTVESFGNIQEAEMEFQVYSYFVQHWKDERLAGKINRTITFKGSDINSFWTPDSYCYNARVTNLMMPPSETHSKVSIDVKGQLTYSRGVSFAASCVMDLHDFPHDSQSCFLKFGSYAYDDRDILYKWKHNDILVSHADMAQFEFVGGSLSSKIDIYLGVPYTTLSVTYTFKRRLGYYIIQVYMPDVMIVLLSWIVFWMKPDDAGDRLTMGITTILTIMFLFGALNASMPRVSYPKAMDWYLMISFMFVFLSVVESLTVFLLSSRPFGMKRWKKEWIYRSIKAKIMSPFRLRRRKTKGTKKESTNQEQVNMDVLLTNQSLPMSLEDMSTNEDRKCHEELMRRNARIAKRIDRASRILFPLSFAVYNLIYWVKYS